MNRNIKKLVIYAHFLASERRPLNENMPQTYVARSVKKLKFNNQQNGPNSSGHYHLYENYQFLGICSKYPNLLKFSFYVINAAGVGFL